MVCRQDMHCGEELYEWTESVLLQGIGLKVRHHTDLPLLTILFSK